MILQNCRRCAILSSFVQVTAYAFPRANYERSVTSLRKILFVVVLVLLTACCAAALADTTVQLSPAPAQVTVKDRNKTILTSDNLDKNTELLKQLIRGKSDVQADFEARGVILQAWTPIVQKYSCLEITVTQDEDSALYYDLTNHPKDKQNWKAYEDSFKNSEVWISQGYTFQSFDQKRAQDNYYLLMKYKRTTAAGEYRGYMAKTIYRGYTITVDMQVYNRLPVEQDATDIYNVIKTLTPVEGTSGQEGTPADGTNTQESPGTDDGSGKPAAAAVPLTITVEPPLETNTNTFTVEGTTAPGMEVVGVLTRITSNEPLQFPVTSHARNGSFKIKVTLPEADENVYLMTVDVLDGDQVVAYQAFHTTTYKKTLIPVTYDSEVPESILTDELAISGTTIKGIQIQCIVNHPDSTWGPKTITTNGTGRFSFKIPTKSEGEYTVTLVFNKKGMETKRHVFTVARSMTEEARQAKIRKEAATIGYAALTSRIDQYIGKTMVFRNYYVVNIEQVGEQWIITAANSQVGDHYSQLMIFTAEEEPSFAVDERHTFYGKCVGSYPIQSEETTEYLPSFDLLFWE